MESSVDPPAERLSRPHAALHAPPARTVSLLPAMALGLAIVLAGGCCLVTGMTLAFGGGWFARTQSQSPVFTVVRDEEIAIGGHARATIENGTDVHQWHFAGEAGQWVLIRVDGLEGCDPAASLAIDESAALAEDDDGGGDFNSVMLVRLPIDARYVVAVRSWSGGRYEIRVDEFRGDAVEDRTSRLWRDPADRPRSGRSPKAIAEIGSARRSASSWGGAPRIVRGRGTAGG